MLFCERTAPVNRLVLKFRYFFCSDFCDMLSVEAELRLMLRFCLKFDNSHWVFGFDCLAMPVCYSINIAIWKRILLHCNLRDISLFRRGPCSDIIGHYVTFHFKPLPWPTKWHQTYNLQFPRSGIVAYRRMLEPLFKLIVLIMSFLFQLHYRDQAMSCQTPQKVRMDSIFRVKKESICSSVCPFTSDLDLP